MFVIFDVSLTGVAAFHTSCHEIGSLLPETPGLCTRCRLRLPVELAAILLSTLRRRCITVSGRLSSALCDAGVQVVGGLVLVVVAFVKLSKLVTGRTGNICGGIGLIRKGLMRTRRLIAWATKRLLNGNGVNNAV